MNVLLLWQWFIVLVAIGVPATVGFLVGTSLSVRNVGWKKFKGSWTSSVSMSFALPLTALLVLQYEFAANEWLLVGGASATIGLVAFADGAKTANPAYRPEGRNPLGMAMEVVIVAVAAAVAGFFWNRLPGGSESDWIFGILLVAFVGYVYFVYDDKPKWDIKGDMPLLIVSFGIEVGMLVGLAVVWWIIFTGISAVASFARLSTLETWLGPKTFLELLLMFWAGANAFLWWAVQEPKERPFPNFTFR